MHALDDEKATRQRCTYIKEAPVTVEWKAHVPPEKPALIESGIARATYAPTQEAPHGTTKNGWAEKHQHQTVLQQHCSFFDRDGDGIIWPTETYQTCRDFGWKIFTSLFFTAFLHAVQSYNTVPGILPDPFFRIWVHNTHMNKHGSGAGIIDSEGRYRTQQLEDFFVKYDKDGKGGLTKWELWAALRRSRMAFDFFGQVSAMFEWGFAWVLLWPEDGVLRKEDVRRLLDGSIYHEKLMQHASHPDNPHKATAVTDEKKDRLGDDSGDELL